MSKRPDPEKLDDENSEWTDETSAQAIKFGELSGVRQRKLSAGRGPQRSPTKVQTAVRYDQDAFAHPEAASSAISSIVIGFFTLPACRPCA
jgi:hypothetical protein